MKNDVCPRFSSPEDALDAAELACRECLETGDVVLNLSGFGLESLPPSLSELTHLEELYLGWIVGNNRVQARNHLEDLPEWLEAFVNLRLLDLSGNLLLTLPARLPQELNTLRLGDNALASLPIAIGDLKHLHSLDVRNNSLSELPAFLGELKQLHSLDVRNNSLSELPAFIGELKQLQSLDVSSNSLSELPAFLGDLKQLHSLDVSSNSLSELPAFLGELKQLQSLDVSFNSLSELPAFLGDLKQLQSLDVSSTSLSELPAFLGDLKQLQSLSIWSNSLSELPAFLGDLKQLHSLDVSFNSLSELPAFLGELKQLHSLDVSFNSLSELPAFLGELKQLQSLDVRNTSLSELPAFLGELKQLQSLDVRNASLSELPAFLGELKQLHSLDVSFNSLSELPAFLGDLKQLHSLDVSFNSLSELPAFLGELKQLQSLNVGNNSLSELPAFLGELKQLQSLDVSFNSLSELPAFLGELKQLQSLDVSANSLSELPAFLGDLKQLQSLNVSSTSLSELPAFLGDLKQLQSLNVSSTSLSELPAFLGDLKQLQSLDVRNNSLSELPPSLGSLRKISYIYLSENPLPESLLSAAANRRWVGVVDWLSSEKEQRWTGKIVLLGDGRVGKTSLVNALEGRENPCDTGAYGTACLERRQWRWEIPAEQSAVSIHLRVWDFGGQFQYRPAQQIFYTGEAIYLVLYDLRGESRKNIKHWIEQVRARAARAKFVIVATHGASDHLVTSLDDWDDIKSRLGDDLIGNAPIVIDSHTGLNIEALKKTLLGLMTEEERFLRTVVKNQVPLRAFLRSETLPPFLSLGQLLKDFGSYEDDLRKSDSAVQKLERGEVEQTLIDLSTEGEIIFHGSSHCPEGEDDRALVRDVVLLAPERLGQATARIVSDDFVDRQQGVVKADYLREVLAREGQHTGPATPPELTPLLLRCLRATWAVSPLTPRGDAGDPHSLYLVPERVGKDKPSHFQDEWPDEIPDDWLEHVRVYQFTPEDRKSNTIQEPLNLRPTGIMFRLIAYLYRYTPGMRTGEVNRNVWWEEGMIIDLGNDGKALLELKSRFTRSTGTLNENLPKLWITMRGPSVETLMEELCGQLLRFVKEQYQFIEHETFLVCGQFCPNSTPHEGHFKLKQIENMQTEAEVMPCQTCDKVVDLTDLRAQRRPEIHSKMAELSAKVDEQHQNLPRQLDRVVKSNLLDRGRHGPTIFSIKEGKVEDFGAGTRLSHQQLWLNFWCSHCHLPVQERDAGIKAQFPNGYGLLTRKPWWDLATEKVKIVAPLARVLGLLTLDSDLVAAEDAESLRGAGIDASALENDDFSSKIKELLREPESPSEMDTQEFQALCENYGTPYHTYGEPCRKLQRIADRFAGDRGLVQGYWAGGLENPGETTYVWLCESCASHELFRRGREPKL